MEWKSCKVKCQRYMTFTPPHQQIRIEIYIFSNIFPYSTYCSIFYSIYIIYRVHTSTILDITQHSTSVADPNLNNSDPDPAPWFCSLWSGSYLDLNTSLQTFKIFKKQTLKHRWTKASPPVYQFRPLSVNRKSIFWSISF